MNQFPYGFSNLPPPSPYAPPPMQPAQPPQAAPAVATLSHDPPPPAPPPLPANSPYGGIASLGAAGGLTAETPGETISDTIGGEDSLKDRLAKFGGGATAGFGASMQKTAAAGQQDAFNLIFHSGQPRAAATSGPIQPISMSDRRAKFGISPAAAQLQAFLESWRRR